MNDLAEIAEVLRHLADRLDRLNITEPEPEDAPDIAFIEVAVAAERFGRPCDSIRKLCSRKGMGEKRGGRWLVNVDAMRTYLSTR